jgi:dTDP-4-dehydrorhamnose reductase
VDKRGSPTYTRDLVLAMTELIQLRATGVYHVAGAGSCSWYEYAEFILKVLGRRDPVEPIQFADLGRPASRPPDTSLTSEQLPKLGIRVRSWQEMVKDYILCQQALA